MRIKMVVIAALAFPGMAAAQNLGADPQIVRGCFASTPPGSVYPPCLGQASGQCQQLPGGSTTIGMMECIQAETAHWDAILNEQYGRTQDFNAMQDAQGASPVMDRTDALRDAQRAWIAFRDADCAARYALWQDGTMRSIVAANCHLTMTAQRALELRDMTGGMQ
ncbi:lysozyme inhibitor LprI family protein [Marivita sp. GX14005]|uniref:lysozyme inhibitor LprI family protein n=1 Tax=Marivita sp. GX14005 TaxID=2942276 RepID=UPI00201A0B9D|nr:lysozyme inhibitor LprI family protein [Marivita sp. GX14005]MCL3882776.1 DUF1311 domain-containing protein [Marivita sp. GX14005]